jgi:hypothetical protein
MTTADHDESKPRRRWPTYLVIVLVLVFVVYPLSAGPAYVIKSKLGGHLHSIVSVVYRPLWVLDWQFSRCKIISAYILWWVEFTG